ncbi:MAG: hypothetical protein LBR21_07300 [Propionibacteriaceae bacterium]|jgi:hypothetical protein|nr:hypothetical protein [Propionibacteriaceae bacterium]
MWLWICLGIIVLGLVYWACVGIWLKHKADDLMQEVSDMGERVSKLMDTLQVQD